MLTNNAWLTRSVVRDFQEEVQATDRYVDVGVVLSVVKRDPLGQELIPGKPRLSCVGSPIRFGGVIDTKLETPRRVGPSKDPQQWYCSEQQLPIILHGADCKSGQIVEGGMGAGKCLDAETEVFDYRTGRRRRVDEPGDLDVATFDKTLKVAPASAFPSGSKPCVDVLLRDGTRLVASTDHPVLTARGWVHAADLRTDDFVAVAAEMPEPTAMTIATDDEVKFVAYMLADGGCTDDSMGFTNETPSVVEEWSLAAAALGYSIRERRQVSRAREFRLSVLDGNGPPRCLSTGEFRRTPDHIRDRWGLYGLAKEKRLHPDLWGLPRSQVALFLNRFWSCDGHVSARGLETTLASEKMIDDLRFMLLRLGVRSRKHYKRSSYVRHGERRSFDAWRLAMWGADALKFLTEVGDVLGKEEACGRLRASLQKVERNTNFDVVPIGRKEISEIHLETLGRSPRGKGRRWRPGSGKQCLSRSTFKSICDQYGYTGKYAHLATSDVAWERVESISDAGVRPVFDLTVPVTNNFVANGIVVHNTTLGVMWTYLRWLEHLGQHREGAITAPTENRLSIVFREVFGLFRPSWYHHSAGSNLLTLCDRTRIQGVSSYKQSEAQGSRFQGYNWSWLFGDEIQDQVTEFVNAMARLRAGRAGGSPRLGTATSKDDPAYRDLKGKLAPEDWTTRRLLGTDSPFVHPDHWESMKRLTSERDYRRLVLAEDLPPDSRLYSSFDRRENLRPIPINARKITSIVLRKKTGEPRDAILVGHDPGAAKAGSVWLDAYEIPQRRGEVLWWVRGELFTLHATHEQHAVQAMKITRDQFGCNVRPDAERAHVRVQPLGQAEDKPDLDVMRIWQRIGFNIKFAQYSVNGTGKGQIKKESRIGMLNTLFCDAAGRRKLFLECDDRGQPTCPQLLAALESMERDHLGRPEHEEKDVRHDKSDLPAALGYALWFAEKESALALRSDIRKQLG